MMQGAGLNEAGIQKKMSAQLFALMDSNADGEITFDEWQKAAADGSLLKKI